MPVSISGPGYIYRKRWMLFVDGENFTIRGQEVAARAGLALRVGEFYSRDCYLWIPGTPPKDLAAHGNGSPQMLHERGERSSYYTFVQGDPDRIGAVRESLWRLGFQPAVFKKPTGLRAKGVDIALTKDVLSNAFLDNYDVAVLVTGDGDYLPVVEEVKRLGKIVTVLFFDEAGGGMNPELRLASDGFVDIGQYFRARWTEYLATPDSVESK
jgi:hypothetical protein